MPWPMFASYRQQAAIAHAMAAKDNTPRRLDSVSLHPWEDFFPVQITGADTGLHAWTERAFQEDGTRYDKPDGRTGIVNGVGGETVTWQPARMPNGSTLTDFPVEAWIKRTIVTSDGCAEYEIFLSSEGGGSDIGIPASTDFTALLGGHSPSRAVFALGTLPDAGLYQVTVFADAILQPPPGFTLIARISGLIVVSATGNTYGLRGAGWFPPASMEGSYSLVGWVASQSSHEATTTVTGYVDATSGGSVSMVVAIEGSASNGLVTGTCTILKLR